jgi:ABC-type glycerol-3-phosphate transport system permease component
MRRAPTAPTTSTRCDESYCPSSFLPSPCVGVTALQFLLVWNDFLVAATLFGRPDGGGAPLPLVVAELVRTWPQELHLQGAGALITVAVPLVVFAAYHQLIGASLAATTVRD